MGLCNVRMRPTQHNKIMELQLVLNTIATDIFRNQGDCDFIAARSNFKLRLRQQFLWSAQQCIEKYLKAILLFNGQSILRYGHNLRALNKAVKNNLSCSLTKSNSSITYQRKVKIAMETYQVDHTLGFRLLGEVLRGNAAPLKGLFAKGSRVLEIWIEKWLERLALEQKPRLETADNMNSRNPLFIPRNHRVEEVLTAASEEGDLQPLERLLKWVRQPYAKADDAWATEPAPVLFTQGYQTFCGT